MDPTRRELYVEGCRDRHFFTWIAGSDMDPNASVREIACVELAGASDGGERGRLLKFAEWITGTPAKIKCFADADCDRLNGRRPPPSTWFTDYRDLEGYTLCLECLRKLLALGLTNDKLSASSLLETTLGEARRVGLLRLLSEREGLKLPFQRTPLRRHVGVSNGIARVRLEAYMTALLQNAGMSLRRLQDISNRLSVLANQCASFDSLQIVHGKDATCILDCVLVRAGAGRDEAARLLWTSYERALVSKGSNLASALAFLVIRSDRA